MIFTINYLLRKYWDLLGPINPLCMYSKPVCTCSSKEQASQKKSKGYKGKSLRAKASLVFVFFPTGISPRENPFGKGNSSSGRWVRCLGARGCCMQGNRALWEEFLFLFRKIQLKIPYFLGGISPSQKVKYYILKYKTLTKYDFFFAFMLVFRIQLPLF